MSANRSYSVKINLNASPEDIDNAFRELPANARSTLEERGFRVPDDLEYDRPTYNNGYYDGTLPRNLDQLPNHEVVELMAVHAEWMRYVNGSVAEATAHKTMLAKKEKAIRASITKERGKEHVDSDVRYIEVSADVTYWDTILGYLEAIRANASNDYKILSRIVTVRGQDIEVSARVNNVRHGY